LFPVSAAAVLLVSADAGNHLPADHGRPEHGVPRLRPHQLARGERRPSRAVHAHLLLL